MKRASLERDRTIHRWLAGQAWRGSARPADLQPGRYRKTRRIGGCGRSRCFLCHYAKLIGYSTVQEERAWLGFQFELIELGLTHKSRRQRLRGRVQPGRSAAGRIQAEEDR